MSDHETNRAYPPRPPYEPPVPAPAPEPDPDPAPGAHARRRARRPVGLLAAVAIVAAAVGGGTATLAAGTFGNGAAPAATFPVPGTNASDTGTGVTEVVEAVTPSVVEIGASSRSGSATGSGVVISEDGEILTNNHVVSGATEIEVTFFDGGTARAEIVGTEPDLDMALIRVEGAGDLTPAELGDSESVRVGDRVVAFGSPQGLSGTVTSGIVSAKGREVTVERTGEEGRPRDDRSWPFEFDGDRYNGELGPETTTYEAIQTDASLNPGNSGGPLVDMNGRVVGINSAIHGNASTAAEAGSVGLGFAVPVDDVKEILDELRAGG
ncbi:trypsin-like peptidase domain-containing protein [Streptomyces verrucosisporus]|uniref:S1C family serine protease n=1 Tax=Streptomyces verrucosisporus TaxID=1695161 RepID=UPI0019D278FF|nr:trypsin-like peptidase domain-containing protein [Streptomyces verrucosisporus]MBN3928669.1 trypsin-like peptidase domain-containing protein [Streptomyces verrucosisporus]